MRRLLLSLTLLLASLVGAQALPGWPMPAPSNPTCKGTAIAAGNATIQTALTAGTTSQTFCLASGTYTGNGPLTFKTGQILQGVSPESTIIDGGSAIASMVTDGAGNNVTLRSLTIRNYTGNCIHGGNTGWTYYNTNFTGCGGALYLTGPASVLGGRIYNNAAFGLHACCTTARILVMGVEVDHNNNACTLNGDSSGSKMEVTNAAFINNYFHENCAVGLWCDIACQNIEISGNKSVNEHGNGIMFEVSGFSFQANYVANTCRIHDNVIIGADGIALYISNSGNCEVWSNYIDTPAAVSGIGSPPSGGVTGSIEVQAGQRTDTDASLCNANGFCMPVNDSFHDNIVIMRAQTIYPNGAWSGNGLNYNPTGNSLSTVLWTHNTYYVPSGGCTASAYFNWAAPTNSLKTFTAWKASGPGQDATGSCLETTPPAAPF